MLKPKIQKLKDKVDEICFPGTDSEDLGFSRASGNMALVEAGIGKPFPHRGTGTTIVAAVYKDGIVMGGDSRATMGNIIGDKFCLKVHELSKSIYACGAGTAADLDNMTRWLAANLEYDELKTGRSSARVQMAVSIASRHLHKYQGYIGAVLLIGGVDVTGVHLYSCSPHGSVFKLLFEANGSGGYAAMSVLERDFKVDMNEEECMALVQRALESGMHGDNASGNTLNLVVINSEGTRRSGPIVPSFTQGQEQPALDYRFANGFTRVLKEKSFPSLD